MVGERLRQARLVAGLTQDQVVALLADQDVSLTKAGLSKYERGKSEPKAGTLLALSRALRVPVGYLLESPPAVLWQRFRKKASLSATRRDEIMATAAHQVEGLRFLRRALGLAEADQSLLTERLDVGSDEDAEVAAQKQRQAWNLGDAPIESMVGLLEGRGALVVVVSSDTADGFDGLSGRTAGGDAAGGEAVVVLRVDGGEDVARRRHSAAHELGHLVMRHPPETDEKAAERFAHRFAGAFLVPETAVRSLLGERRRRLDFEELALLKAATGLSVQGWARRARDLGVVTDGAYRDFCIEVSRTGRRLDEGCPYRGQEEPTMLKRLALRALSEGIVGVDRVRSICPDLAAAASPATALRASDIRRLPAAEREPYLRAIAASREARMANPPGDSASDAFG